jgi:Trypsin-like peptidase domain/Tetratricopeptide repeat
VTLNRRALWFVTGFLFLFWGTVSLFAEELDSAQVEQQARPAVVLLIVSDANGKPYAIGTGFFVSSDGKIVTNRHVIEGASSAVAKTENGTIYPVKGILGIHRKADIALLQSVAHDVPFIEIVPADYTPLGSSVMVIGNPRGEEGKITVGQLTTRGDWHNAEKMVVTALVAPGSSGSPVLNARGEAIGVVFEEDLGQKSVTYALPGELPREVLAEFGEGGRLQSFDEINWGETYKVRLDPTYEEAMEAVGTQNFEKAHRLLMDLSHKFPNNSELWQRIGMVSDRLKLENESQGAFKRATELDPQDSVSWFCLARSYFMTRQIDQGISASVEAVKYEPNFYEAIVNLGLAYAQQGDMSEAEVQLQKATRIKPDDDTAYVALGRIRVFQKRLEEGADYFEKAAMINPNQLSTWQVLLDLDHRLGRADREWSAERHIKELSADSKTN